MERTGLTFKLDFPGDLWLAAFAILAMFHLVSVSKNVRVHELARRFCLYLPIVAHSVDLGHAELQNWNKGKALRSNSALMRLLRFFFLSWSSFFTVWLRVLICRPGWVFFYLVEVVCLVEVSYLVEVADSDWREVDLAYRAGCVADRDRRRLLDPRTW